jgi:hypothetical protein
VLPSQYIDHINGQRNDNRIVNLRDASPETNVRNQLRPSKNSKTGVLGVVKTPSDKFRANIGVGNRVMHLGVFETLEGASAAYKAAKRTLHKEAVEPTA